MCIGNCTHYLGVAVLRHQSIQISKLHDSQNRCLPSTTILVLHLGQITSSAIPFRKGSLQLSQIRIPLILNCIPVVRSRLHLVQRRSGFVFIENTKGLADRFKRDG